MTLGLRRVSLGVSRKVRKRPLGARGRSPLLTPTMWQKEGVNAFACSKAAAVSLIMSMTMEPGDPAACDKTGLWIYNQGCSIQQSCHLESQDR